MAVIRKSSNPANIPAYNKEYWWVNLPEERLETALKPICPAKAIYYANPKNLPLGNGGQVFKSDKSIDYRRY